MKPVRNTIGGLGNLMFKQAYLLGKTLDGEIQDPYVQNLDAWRNHQDSIRATFSEGIGPQIDAVALHIRRGDYLNAEHFHTNLWKTDYYQKAIAMFPNRKFIVFCKDNQGWEQDKADRQWCRDNLSSLISDFELPSKDNSETEDLNLMAQCKDLIMANSTFSWWAAFLGNHEKVVCPTNWFTDGVQRVELLPEWIKI